MHMHLVVKQVLRSESTLIYLGAIFIGGYLHKNVFDCVLQ
jgi:hypothetical protein